MDSPESVITETAPFPRDDVETERAPPRPDDGGRRPGIGEELRGGGADSSDAQEGELDPGSGRGPVETTPLGQAPEDISHVFLRLSSTLLPRGESQVESGFTYIWQDAETLAVLPGGILEVQRVRDRRFLVPLTLRHGLTDDFELFGTVPVGLSHFERTDSADGSSTLVGGLGDVSFGLLRQLERESASWPDIIGSLSVSAPTGPHPFGPSLNVASFGTGFWSIGAGLNCVRSYDPVVLYGGFGYRHEFARSFNGVRIQPGETVTYSCGAGLSINDDIALNAEFSGAFQTRARIDGVASPVSSLEPVSIRLGVTRRVSARTSIQPFVSFGVTRDAPDFVAGFFLIQNKRCWGGGGRCDG